MSKFFCYADSDPIKLEFCFQTDFLFYIRDYLHRTLCVTCTVTRCFYSRVFEVKYAKLKTLIVFQVNRERLSLLKLQALHQSNIACHLSSASIIVKPPKILSCNCLLHVLDGTQPPKHELMALITLSGGWLVDNPEHAKYLIGQRNGQNLTAKRLDRRMNLFNVPVVKETWILGGIF